MMRRYASFFDWCSSQNATICPAAHHGKALDEVWTELLHRAESTPVLCQSDDSLYPNVTAATIRAVALSYLYKPILTWPLLSLALYQAAFENNAALFQPLLMSAYTTLYNASAQYGNIAITTADLGKDAQSSPQDMLRKQMLASSETPLLKGCSTSWVFFRRALG